MTILTDKRIFEYIKKQKLKIMPFNSSAVTSNGYDLLLDNFEIKPGESKLVTSLENVRLPNNLIAIPFLRTTYAFKGLVLSPAIIDAGSKQHLDFMLCNVSKNKIKTIKSKLRNRVIHLLFVKTDGRSAIPFGERDGEVNSS